MMTTGFVVVVVLVGLLTVVTGSVAAQQADSVVAPDGSEDYTSIQSAIDSANTVIESELLKEPTKSQLL